MSSHILRGDNPHSGLLESIRLHIKLGGGLRLVQSLSPVEAKALADEIYDALEIPKIGFVDTSLPKRKRKSPR